MQLTALEAITELNNNPGSYTTSESLIGLMNKVSTHAEGSITLLYSGKLGGVRGRTNVIY